MDATRTSDAPRSLREYFRRGIESQRALADRAGVHQSMISMMVRGERAARGALALKLSQLTGVPVERLVVKAKKPRRNRKRNAMR